MNTNRCVGWMLERRSETVENYASSSDESKGAEGSVVAKDKEEEDSEDDDASASRPSPNYSSYDKEDDEYSTAGSYYVSFYNTPSESEEEERNFHNVEAAAQNYYVPLYDTPPESEGAEGYDDGYSTVQLYYVSDYTISLRAEEKSDHDDEGSSDYSEHDDDLFINTPYSWEFGSDDDDEGPSNSTSSEIPSNKTASLFVRQESHLERHALTQKYRSLNRGPLYDQCKVIVAPSFTIPVNSVNTTMSGCFFQKVELANPSTKENCIAVCQNQHSSVHATCIAWMWRAEEEDCVRLVLTADSNYSFCGLP